MNTVLFQEVIRYNRLLTVMKSTLINVKKALKGQVVMSEELEGLANSLYDNQVHYYYFIIFFIINFKNKLKLFIFLIEYNLIIYLYL